MHIPAILVLKDGSIFRGASIGASGQTVGEVVFNTAMTGYQEILTDPSYARQIVTLTYPHVGNTGINPDDSESASALHETAQSATTHTEAVHVAGLVIRDLPRLASNWRSAETLGDFLKRHNIVAIADLDTRRLTRKLRELGAQSGCILAGEQALADSAQATAQAAAESFPGLAGMDLASVVSCSRPYKWSATSWSLKKDGTQAQQKDVSSRHVVAMDFGVKANILRMLADRGCELTVVPASTTATDIMKLAPDGVFLSNGPGDPEPCEYAIATITEILRLQVPVFGICLGHQLLALASGARTVKMKFGHHGANHPVQDLATGKVMISSQNHGFAVDPDSLGKHLAITHLSLFDGSLQGIRRTDVPAFSFQGHPEASPGPHDVAELFDEFIVSMDTRPTRPALNGREHTDA